VVEAQADRDLEKTQGIIRDTIRDAVKKVKPGDWVVLEMRPHPEAPGDVGLWGMTRRLTSRKTLDLWAPNNPVLMRPVPVYSTWAIMQYKRNCKMSNGGAEGTN
jgi:hypothetical protein